MFRRASLCGLIAAGVLLAAPAAAQEWTWGSMAIVSDTLGANANRLCVGAAASRRPGDFGCPSFAPYVSSSGNVGIGTTAPAATLQVSGSFIVSTSGQTTTPSLYVGTNGMVGIGTKSPASPLVVSGTNGIRIENNGWAGLNQHIYSTSAYPTFTAYRYRGTSAAPATVVGGDALSVFGAYGYNGSANSYAGDISIIAASDFSTSVNSIIRFATVQSGVWGEKARGLS